mgnify:CR=1 FL=1
MKSREFLVIVILIIFVIVFIKLGGNDVVYVPSDIDQRSYLVRDLDDKQKASNLLARIRGNIYKLSDYVSSNKEKYKEYRDYIDQLETRIKGMIINESAPDSTYTSYSVNKGEQIVFCLRSRRSNKIHPLNLIMYVTIHELAHVACPEYGHTPLFKHIFAFLADVSVEIGIYKKIDFNIDPKEYCGMTITDSII